MVGKWGTGEWVGVGSQLNLNQLTSCANGIIENTFLPISVLRFLSQSHFVFNISYILGGILWVCRPLDSVFLKTFILPATVKQSKSCSYVLLMFGICVKTGTVKHPSCVWTEQTISSDSDHRPSAELSRGPDGLGLCSSLASLPTSSLHACQMWREGRIHQNLFNQEHKRCGNGIRYFLTCLFFWRRYECRLF